MKLIVCFFCFSFNFLFANSIDVTVSILPQKYFVEKIAKDKVNVTVMVKPGFSPHNYEPKTSQMIKLSNSMIYFSIGVTFEKVWLDKFKSFNKNMKIIDISKGVTKQAMLHHDHEHENEREDESNNKIKLNHNGLDPHIWLNPILVKQQSFNIYKALSNIDETNKTFYWNNYNSFIKELELLDGKLKDILKESKHTAFMVFHPSWGYFATRYDLEQIAVEIEGKEPKFSEIINLVKKAKESKIKILFVSPQFSQKSAEVIASNIKGKTIKIDSLAYDYEENLISTAEAIVNSNK